MESSCGSNFIEGYPNRSIRVIMNSENDVDEFNFELMHEDSINRMAFRTIDVAHKFYVEYGRYKGFKPRITGTQYVDGGIAKFRRMECNRAGIPKAPKGDGRRRRRGPVSKKCDCQAKLHVVLRKRDNFYYVTNFESQHNHELATAETDEIQQSEIETQ